MPNKKTLARCCLRALSSKKAQALLSATSCVCLLTHAAPRAAHAQTPPDAFVAAEGPYYDTGDILRQMAPFVQAQQVVYSRGYWVPNEGPPSNGILYVTGAWTLITSGGVYSQQYVFKALRVANQQYCQLRDYLTPKASPDPYHELPKCYAVVLNDALSQLAKSQDLAALQQAVSNLQVEVENLKKRKGQ